MSARAYGWPLFMGGLFVARIVIYKPRQWRHCYNDSLFRNEIFSVSVMDMVHAYLAVHLQRHAATL